MIDGLAILIRDDFHRAGMKRMEAAWHVRAFWDQWGMAGARIEHRKESVLFAAVKWRTAHVGAPTDAQINFRNSSRVAPACAVFLSATLRNSWAKCGPVQTRPDSF